MASHSNSLTVVNPFPANAQWSATDSEITKQFRAPPSLSLSPSLSWCAPLSFGLAGRRPIGHNICVITLPHENTLPPVCAQLPAPTVKGFDFAKLHLGQHGKDDLMVVQEPGPQGPHPAPGKEGLHPPENREIPVPTSKTSVSSVKASLSGRRRERWVGGGSF